MILRALAFAAFALAMLSPPALADEDADRAASVAAATLQADRWLRAMDDHLYSEGWNESASVVKEGRTEQGWIQEVSGPREALGKPVMREFKQAEYATHVRGAPEGKYVTAVYLTKFTNIPLATETILLSFEDGQWRVGGYSIQEAQPSSTPPSEPAPAAKPKD
jgi:hypothetical protein